MAITAYSLPYHEPDIVTILILSTFLLALNVVNYALDRLIYCGLLGQILLGILWGTPGAKWLSEGSESVMVNLGYLGLILLVYEGGLSTSFKSLKSNLGLSVGVACTGVGLPIALSYVLLRLADATPLQAFAAGAALCSTSLGTTFTVLETSGLITTRMGVVLASAAMMDDVVGLVMVQVITKLGASSPSSSFSSITVIRPVFVSLALALAVPVVARLIIKPATERLNAKRDAGLSRRLELLLGSSSFVLTMHTTILLGLVTGSSYAGTSNLFAAYLAGAAISWWDFEVAHPSSTVNKSSKTAAEDSKAPERETSGNIIHDTNTEVRKEANSGEEIFKRFFKPGLESILRPLFFASIGFSIPIRQMFTGAVVWRGIVYVVLMAIGKLVCGTWLIRLSAWTLRKPRNGQPQASKSSNAKVSQRTLRAESGSSVRNATSAGQVFDPSDVIRPESEQLELSANNNQQSVRGQEQATINASNISRPLSAKKSMQHPHNVQPTSKPLSLYPAAIVGCAMISRGEIGFLISSLAESNGIFRNQKEPSNSDDSNVTDEIFLVVTWAIMLCTIIGPICVGLMVGRMNRLEKKAIANGTARRNALGVWG